jgi:hypothetical protein
VSGAAAAYWHGLLDRAPAEVEATVPRRNGPGCRPGALVRRRDLLAADLVRIRDVWLTDVPLTVVEVDGWAWHVDPERFRADRRKQNALVRDGWGPLRFTWHDLDQRPRSVADEIWSTVQGR